MKRLSTKLTPPTGFLTREDLRSLPGIEWLVPGYFQKNSVAMVYGSSGACKSYFMLDIACTLSTGENWFGHQVEDSGPVVYVVAEGEENLDARISAWEGEHGQTITDLYVHRTVDIKDADAVDDFIRKLKSIQPIAVLWSPYYMLSGDSDEISAKEVKPIWRNIDRVRRQTGAIQIVEHHSAENSSRPRGSTVMENILWTEIHIVKRGDVVSVRCEKQRNGKKFESFNLVIESCGPDAVLRVQTTKSALEAKRKSSVSKNGPVVLAAVKELGPSRFRDITQKIGLHDNTVNRELKALIADGLVVKDGYTYIACIEKAPEIAVSRPLKKLRSKTHQKSAGRSQKVGPIPTRPNASGKPLRRSGPTSVVVTADTDGPDGIQRRPNTSRNQVLSTNARGVSLASRVHDWKTYPCGSTPAVTLRWFQERGIKEFELGEAEDFVMSKWYSRAHQN